MPYLDKTELSGIRASLLHPEVIRDVVVAVKEKVSISVGIKIVYNPIEPDPMYEAIRSSGVDFVHVYYSPPLQCPMWIWTRVGPICLPPREVSQGP